MSKKSFKSKVWMGSAVLVSSLMLYNCTSMVTEEQLAQLDELRKAEKSLTNEIAEKKSEKAGLQKELKSRQAEFVKGKLSQWPNVWPDWSPEPKEEPEVE